MARLTKRDWLSSGLDLLAEHGAASLTIELLTSSLGVTKGSFYHHFKSFADYKTALLGFFEDEHTLDVIEHVEQQATPTEKLRHLFAIATSGPATLEIMIRAWARQDEEARKAQERIDTRRMSYVYELCLQIVADPLRAQRMSQLAYTILVGSMELEPPLAPDTCRELFNEFCRVYQID